MRYLVYGLTDPRTGLVRYIGLSTRGLKRPRLHGRKYELERRPGHRANWIRELQRLGLNYGIVVLYQAPTATGLDEAEIFWIAEGRRRGWPLTNMLPGGELARMGVPHSSEARAKMAAADRSYLIGNQHGKGRRHTPEEIARISAAGKGHAVSAETRAKIAASNRGNRNSLGSKRTPETRALLSALKRGNKNMLGHKHTPETKARCAEAARRRWARVRGES